MTLAARIWVQGGNIMGFVAMMLLLLWDWTRKLAATDLFGSRRRRRRYDFNDDPARLAIKWAILWVQHPEPGGRGQDRNQQIATTPTARMWVQDGEIMGLVAMMLLCCVREGAGSMEGSAFRGADRGWVRIPRRKPTYRDRFPWSAFHRRNGRKERVAPN
jgi:hypothetical protein